MSSTDRQSVLFPIWLWPLLFDIKYICYLQKCLLYELIIVIIIIHDSSCDGWLFEIELRQISNMISTFIVRLHKIYVKVMTATTMMMMITVVQKDTWIFLYDTDPLTNDRRRRKKTFRSIWDWILSCRGRCAGRWWPSREWVIYWKSIFSMQYVGGVV